VIRVYDDAGNVIKTHEHNGDFKSGELLTRIVSTSLTRFGYKVFTHRRKQRESDY